MAGNRWLATTSRGAIASGDIGIGAPCDLQLHFQCLFAVVATRGAKQDVVRNPVRATRVFIHNGSKHSLRFWSLDYDVT